MESKNRKMTVTFKKTEDVDLSKLEEIFKYVKSADNIDEEGKEFLIVCAEGILRKLKPVKEPRKEAEATQKATNNRENEKSPDKKPSQEITEDDEQEIKEISEEYRKACLQYPNEIEEISSDFNLDDPSEELSKMPKDKRNKLRSRIAELYKA